MDKQYKEELTRSFIHLMENSDRYPDLWKKVCELLDEPETEEEYNRRRAPALKGDNPCQF